jgi:hypothetical protein
VYRNKAVFNRRGLIVGWLVGKNKPAPRIAIRRAQQPQPTKKEPGTPAQLKRGTPAQLRRGTPAQLRHMTKQSHEVIMRGHGRALEARCHAHGIQLRRSPRIAKLFNDQTFGRRE